MGEELRGGSPSISDANGGDGRFMLAEQDDNGLADSDNLLGELFFDPMAPLDFGGIDLNTISGFPDDSEGVVPVQPFRDGMVPEIGNFQPSIITTGIKRQTESTEHRAESTKTDNARPQIRTGGYLHDALSKSSMKGTQEGAACSRQDAKRVPYDDEEPRSEKLARYRAKKARRKLLRPKIMYESRKRTAEEKPRIKGRFVRPEQFAAYQAQKEVISSVESMHLVPT